jgi:hypothetical protein
MKKFLVAGILSIALLFGFSGKADNKQKVETIDDEGYHCATEYFDCKDNTGSYGLICATNYDDYIVERDDMYYVLCVLN